MKTFHRTWGILRGICVACSLNCMSRESRSICCIWSNNGRSRRSFCRGRRRVWTSLAWRLLWIGLIKKWGAEATFWNSGEDTENDWETLRFREKSLDYFGVSRRIARIFARRQPPLPWPKFSTSAQTCYNAPCLLYLTSQGLAHDSRSRKRAAAVTAYGFVCLRICSQHHQ